MFKVTSMSTYAHVLAARVLGGYVGNKAILIGHGRQPAEVTDTWPSHTTL